MKIRVTLKDPDVLHDAIADALDEELKEMDQGEAELVKDYRKDKILEIAADWFEYGEYLTVEIDTKSKTCVVIPVER